MSFVLEDQTSPSAGQSGVVVAPGASTLGRSSILSSSAGLNALADFATDTPTATATATPEPTETPVPPTETPVPPTETPAPIVQALADEPEPEPPTATPEPPTPEPPTATPIPPTATPSPVPTATPTPPPSPTPARTPRASATATPDPSAIPGIASVYWDGLAGNYFACSSYGTYNPSNPLIVAVSYERAAEWPCGTELQVCGVATGACLTVVRVDLCPGCLLNHIDLSAAGFQHVCANVTPCGVTIRRQY